MLHEGGQLKLVFTSSINTLRTTLDRPAGMHFVPIHFQEKSGVVY